MVTQILNNITYQPLQHRKYCTACKQTLPIASYSLNKQNITTGLHWICKKCQNKKNKDWKTIKGIKTYIYTISNPVSKQIIYIGKTKTHDPNNRKVSHFNTPNSTPISNEIFYLKSQNITPLFEIIDIVDDELSLFLGILLYSTNKNMGVQFIER